MIHQHTLATIRNLITDMTVRIPDDLYVGVMEESSLELALIGIKTFVQDHSNAAMVVTPPMDPRLWSIEFDTKRRRWEEENAGDHL